MLFCFCFGTKLSLRHRTCNINKRGLLGALDGRPFLPLPHAVGILASLSVSPSLEFGCLVQVFSPCVSRGS